MFKLEEFMGKRVLTSSLLDGEDVTAFFTTRDLPLKSGERDDLIEEVENNKKLVCKGLNIPQENLIIPIQTHSDNVEIIKMAYPIIGKDTNPPAFQPSSLPKGTDALVTNHQSIAIALNFADCVPIIFYDPIKKVVAIAHAGWRGTVSKIGPKTVNKMVENFSSKPEDIIALIGPSIGKCCFEVKDEVLEQITKSILPLTPTRPLRNDTQSFLRQSRKGRGGNPMLLDHFVGEAISGIHADLKLINKIQLLAIGVQKIDLCEYCTFCQSELFFSYRKENGKTARHSAVIMLKS